MTNQSDPDFMYNWIREKSGKTTKMENKTTKISSNYDHCVLCGVETAYKRSTHIDMRIGYVEGAGQLCKDCFDRTNTTYDHLEHILVSVYTIKSTSNDQELGAKVRKLYWESQK